MPFAVETTTGEVGWIGVIIAVPVDEFGARHQHLPDIFLKQLATSAPRMHVPPAHHVGINCGDAERNLTKRALNGITVTARGMG